MDADELARLASVANEIVIVAPYVKRAPLQYILSDMRPGSQLTCVSRWTAGAILSGASDVASRRAVVDRGGTFRLHPRLHAKYFRFSDRILVGSANVTGNGLGLSAIPNLEILCEPADSFDAVAFEQDAIRESRVVGDQEAEMWEAFAELGSQTVRRTREQEANLSTWLPVTRDPDHVWLAYLGRGGDIPSADEQRLAREDLSVLMPPASLDRRQFDAWLGGCLLSSARVQDVRFVVEMEEVAAWDALSESWGVIRSEALRARSTVENWLATFLNPPLPH